METARVLEHFLGRARAKKWSPKTRESYLWAFGYLQVEQLPEDTATLDLLLGQAADRLGDTSLYDVWRRWRALYRWAAVRLQVPNPMERIDPNSGRVQLLVEKPIVPETLPRILSRGQVHQLLTEGCPTNRDRLMVLVTLDMGLRLSEVAGLTKMALNPDGIRVRGKGRKERVVPITKDLLSELLFIGDVDCVWTTPAHRPLARDGVKMAFRRIFARAGIKAGPHSLRHTFATEYLRRGGKLWALQRILGHADVRTTEIYLHLVGEDLAKDHREVSPVREWMAPMGRLL